MKHFYKYLGCIALTLLFNLDSIAQKTIEFPSKDGLLISADLYEIVNSKLTILLCHQAGYSRGEYLHTAIALNELGYSCLAIDQRSGKGVNDVLNETNKRAKEKGLPTSYIDAKQDIEAAIDYLYSKNNKQPILIAGSSYSASLVLVIGKDNMKVKAVASFSPGEYLKGVAVAKFITGYSKPVFVTSSNSETLKVEKLVLGISTDYLTHYKPNEKGIHGSRALWETTQGTEGYWKVFSTFLKSNE